MCEHLLASHQSLHHAYVYMAILQSNTQLIDDHLREQVTNAKADVCGSCKDAVESAKDFLNNALVRKNNLSLFLNKFVYF